MNVRFVALSALALSLAAVAAVAPVVAQTPAPTPTPVNLPTVPPNAAINPYVKSAIDILTGVVNHEIQTARNSSNGQVTYFKRFEMQIQTGPNAYRSIHLHQGTVINPIGRSITVGQQVHIDGATQSDGSLAANAITIDQ